MSRKYWRFYGNRWADGFYKSVPSNARPSLHGMHLEHLPYRRTEPYSLAGHGKGKELGR